MDPDHLTNQTTISETYRASSDIYSKYAFLSILYHTFLLILVQ